jgi:FlgN protein
MASEYRELVLGEEFMDLLREPVAAVDESVDVEALGESLEANLRAQLSLYRDYVEVANRQKLAMVNGRVSETNEVNAESEHLLATLGALEADRAGIVGKILAGRPGFSGAAALVKCELLYPFFSPALALRIKGARASLLKTVEELKRVMSVNRALVENGSRILHTTIGIMTSVVGRGKQEKMAQTYTKKGAINVGKVQVRNLFNRSV